MLSTEDSLTTSITLADSTEPLDLVALVTQYIKHTRVVVLLDLWQSDPKA